MQHRRAGDVAPSLGEDRPWLSKFTRHVSQLFPQRSRWHLRRLLFTATRPRWTLPSGVRMRIDSIWDWTAYDEIFLRGAYDVAIERALANREKGSTLRIVDLGSNLGLFTLRVVDRLRTDGGSEEQLQAILVDASAAILTESEQRLQKDNGLACSFRLVHGLVGQRSGFDHLSRERSHLFPSLRRSGAEQGERVDYVDLLPLTAEMAQIDLLKCDIEGAELAFLENYPEVLAKTRVATFELHHNLIDTRRCRESLRMYGFADYEESSVEPESSIYTVWR